MFIAINILLFPLIPLFSSIALLLMGKWLIFLLGVLIVILTPSFFTLLYSIEKRIFGKLSKQNLAYITPVYYTLLGTTSILLSWYLLNFNDRGNFWSLLYTYACTYTPYNYLVNGEQATKGSVNLMTNVTNNFVVVGGMIFLLSWNFINTPTYVSLALLLAFGVFLMHTIPNRILETNA